MKKKAMAVSSQEIASNANQVKFTQLCFAFPENVIPWRDSNRTLLIPTYAEAIFFLSLRWSTYRVRNKK
jgi:hypothetical protein